MPVEHAEGTVIDLSAAEQRIRAAGPGEPDQSGVIAPVTAPGGDLLHRVALTLNSTLELREVLHNLAGMALEATDAARCSLFLIEDGTLEPTVAIGTVPDEDLWAAFQDMGPIDLERVAALWGHLLEGDPVAIADASQSSLIPREWIDRFTVQSLALIPLADRAAPCGVMAIDYQHTHDFAPGELELLSSIGTYAGMAVRNARLYEATRRRAAVQEALARGAGALASHLGVAEIAETLVDAYADLLGARVCGVGLFDDNYTRITPVATRGTRSSEGPYPVTRVTPQVVETVTTAWTRRVEPLEFDNDPYFDDLAEQSLEGEERPSRYLLIPLVVEQRVRGAIVLGFDHRADLGAEAREAATALAAIAAAAMDRTGLLERLSRQVRRIEILYALSTNLAEGASADSLVAELNRLLHGYGVEVVSLSFRDKALAQLLRGATMTRAERAAVGGAQAVPQSDDTLVVPMRLGRRLVGALRVRPADVEDEDRSFVEALARGVAEVTNRWALRSALEEAALEQAVADERERIAADLHDSVGQLFVALGLMTRRDREQLPDGSRFVERFTRLVDLADRGKWEIDQAIRALTFMPASQRGLAVALRDRVDSLEADSGIQVDFDIAGSPVRLAPRIERALYRIAHEALTNAWRHARAGSVEVVLTFGRADVSLRVRDDGVGLPGSVEPPTGVGTASMRRAIDEVGGRLSIANVEAGGVLVEAVVPRELR
ncbi:MAG: GAF domain-containing protein [Actinobacteria bacterium]|nr:GAF domain-containing protein [Actinomycetota bacterium]